MSNNYTTKYSKEDIQTAIDAILNFESCPADMAEDILNIVVQKDPLNNIVSELDPILKHYIAECFLRIEG